MVLTRNRFDGRGQELGKLLSKPPHDGMSSATTETLSSERSARTARTARTAEIAYRHRLDAAPRAANWGPWPKKTTRAKRLARWGVGI